MNKIIIFLILFMLIPTGSAEIYYVFVDKEFGFFSVRSNNITNTLNYSNRTLHINVGDKVIWENYDISNERITIISGNKLWNNSIAILGWKGKQYEYIFNKSGTYNFFIKENQIFQMPENFTEPINTTDWLKYRTKISTRYQKIIVEKQSTPTKISKKKINTNTTKTSNIIKNIYDTEDEITPKTINKIEKNISKYQKYTLLKIIKLIFKKDYIKNN